VSLASIAFWYSTRNTRLIISFSIGFHLFHIFFHHGFYVDHHRYHQSSEEYGENSDGGMDVDGKTIVDAQ